MHYNFAIIRNQNVHFLMEMLTNLPETKSQQMQPFIAIVYGYVRCCADVFMTKFCRLICVLRSADWCYTCMLIVIHKKLWHRWSTLDCGQKFHWEFQFASMSMTASYCFKRYESYVNTTCKFCTIMENISSLIKQLTERNRENQQTTSKCL